MTTLRLCILENGLISEPLDKSFDSYPAMIREWLSPKLPEATFHTVSVVAGESLPNPEDFDGYVLTGSKHSVYEKAAWIQAEIDFLRRAKELKCPIFGICFGHQLMADAFGGRTSKAAAGWGVGAQSYVPNDPEAKDVYSVLAFHQDQIEVLPPQAEVLAGTDHCPYGVIRYDFPALSVQYHPEFSTDYVEALLHQFGDDLFEESTTAKALDSLRDVSLANDQIAASVARFFRTHNQERHRSRRELSQTS